MHVVKRFSTSENLIASGVNDVEVAQHLYLKVGGDVGSTLSRFTGQGVDQRIQSEGAIQRHAVEAVHRVEQEGGASQQTNQCPVG